MQCVRQTVLEIIIIVIVDDQRVAINNVPLE